MLGGDTAVLRVWGQHTTGTVTCRALVTAMVLMSVRAHACDHSGQCDDVCSSRRGLQPTPPVENVGQFARDALEQAVITTTARQAWLV